MGGVHSSSTPADSLFYLREPLLKFYQAHNPEKIDKVDSILAGFGEYGVQEGSEILNLALMKEYGVGLGLDIHRMTAKALYNFNGMESGDLSFREGQMIEVTSSRGNWWEGTYVNRKGRRMVGAFPSNYVKVIESRAASSPDLEASEKRGNQLFRAILELVTTEYKYVQDLQIVMDVFVTPMERGFGPELTKQIFSSWPEILLVHEQILSDMQKCLPDVKYVLEKFGNFQRPSGVRSFTLFDGKETTRSKNGLVDMITLGRVLDTIREIHDGRLASNTQMTSKQRTIREKLLDDTVTRLSKVMIRMSNFLKTATPYIANYNAALETIERLHATHAQAESLIQVCEKSSLVNNFHLRDYLIKPVQRVCKYPLLLKEIQNSVSGEAKKFISTAVSKVLVVADEVNEMVKQTENSSAQIKGDVISKLRPVELVKSLDLSKPSSRMFRQGKVMVLLTPGGQANLKLESKRLHAFLFTGFILLTEQHVSKMNLLNKRTVSYRILFPVDLGEAVQATREEQRYNNRTFALQVSPPGQDQVSSAYWVFTLESEAECDGWVADLAEALSITAADRARRSKVLGNQREQWRKKQLMAEQQKLTKQNMQVAQYQHQQMMRQQQMGNARHTPSMYSVASAISETPGAPSAPPRYVQPQQPGQRPQNGHPPTMNQVMWELNYTMNQHRLQQQQQQKRQQRRQNPAQQDRSRNRKDSKDRSSGRDQGSGRGRDGGYGV